MTSLKFLLFMCYEMFICFSPSIGFLLGNSSLPLYNTKGNSGVLSDNHYVHVLDEIDQDRRKMQQLEQFVIQQQNEMTKLKQEISLSQPTAINSNTVRTMTTRMSHLESVFMTFKETMNNLQNEIFNLQAVNKTDNDQQLQKNYAQIQKENLQLKRDTLKLQQENLILQSKMNKTTNETFLLRQVLSTLQMDITQLRNSRKSQSHDLIAMKNVTGKLKDQFSTLKQSVEGNFSFVNQIAKDAFQALSLLNSTSNICCQNIQGLMNRTKKTESAITSFQNRFRYISTELDRLNTTLNNTIHKMNGFVCTMPGNKGTTDAVTKMMPTSFISPLTNHVTNRTPTAYEVITGMTASKKQHVTISSPATIQATTQSPTRFQVSLITNNCLDIATRNSATTFVQLIKTAGLEQTFQTQSPLTLIVPTNKAFAKLSPATVASLQKDTSALANVLNYHIVKGAIYSWDMVSGEILRSLNGHYIRVNSQASSLYFNEAKVTNVDLQCTNGVIYLVDRVLNVPEGTIVDIIKNPDYNIGGFMEFLEAAKLTDVFNRTSSQRYTMFVPTNAAIASLDADYIAKLKSSFIYARHIVDYHVHPGTIHENSLDHAGTLSTMYRGHSINVTVDSNNNPVLNHEATLQVTDIEAENGVVHIISHVLIHSTLNSGVIG